MGLAPPRPPSHLLLELRVDLEQLLRPRLGRPRLALETTCVFDRLGGPLLGADQGVPLRETRILGAAERGLSGREGWGEADGGGLREQRSGAEVGAGARMEKRTRRDSTEAPLAAPLP
jgi:hypothetical protein